MGASRVRGLAIISLVVLLASVVTLQTRAMISDRTDTYWYTGNNFDLNHDDLWVPFFAGTDVPNSLPLRGFISDSRNYFLDFGALDWLSEWIEYRYAWSVHEHEKELNPQNLTGQLEYLFETATARLQKPSYYIDVDYAVEHAMDYVKDFDAPYEAFIPLIVMYGLNETYDDTLMHQWVLHPDIVESTLAEAFPLVSWETELFWFDYGNHSEFADLMMEKTQDTRIMIDEDYLNRTDYILHEIISADPRYNSSDMVLPALVMLQHNTLWSVYYEMAIGGLGRINSTFPEVDSWCLNGRNVYAYFYGGDPTNPRASITPTVIHELGHCIGQTDIHSIFGWVFASSSMSVMCAYQQPTSFDRFDMDLINNAQGLQLWGRYLDEIEYFRGFSLNTSQQVELTALEDTLSSVPDLLISSNINQLRLLLHEADSVFNQLSGDLIEPRKSENWSDLTSPLDVHIDWIVGPGIPNAEDVAESIRSDLNTSRLILPFEDTILPTPTYNVTIDVHATSAMFDASVYQFWGQNMVESDTSVFIEAEVPPDAWSSPPVNRVFQNQSGYAIDGYIVEDWLTENPFTDSNQDKVHYRFYIMNLENLTDFTPDNSGIIVVFLIAGAGITLVAGVIFAMRRKS